MATAKHWALLIFLLGSSFAGFSQVNRYMVFFKDKEGTSYSTSQPLQFLSQKAVDRRIRQGITVLPEDLPVNISYIQQVKTTGAEIFFTTRWMNGLLVQCQSSLLPTIEALSFVDHIELAAPQARLLNAGRKGERGISARKKITQTGIKTQTQLQMLGIPEMHEKGYRGEGMTIAVFDGGFLGVSSVTPFQHIFDEGRFNDSASHDFVRNTKNVFQYDNHGTNVLSVIAANIPDDFTGGAYEAYFQLYVTEDVSSEYRIEEYNWLFAAERADSAGVDIVSSSLGYYDLDNFGDIIMSYTKDQMDGKTTVVTRAAQMLANRGVVVVCSAGNEGNVPSWRIISAPADAVDVIAVANVNAQGAVHSSSSRGPTADGRIKPDLAALGVGVSVVMPSGNTSTSTGTSLAAPLITSLVAGVWQLYPHLTSKEVVRVLKETASRANNPNIEVGYGIPNFNKVISYLDNASPFRIYPNPVIDTLTVKPFDPDTTSECRIELISSQGQAIASETVSFNAQNNIYHTNLSTLSAGLYYLRISSAQKRFVYRVVKL